MWYHLNILLLFISKIQPPPSTLNSQTKPRTQIPSVVTIKILKPIYETESYAKK